MHGMSIIIISFVKNQINDRLKIINLSKRVCKTQNYYNVFNNMKMFWNCKQVFYKQICSYQAINSHVLAVCAIGNSLVSLVFILGQIIMVHSNSLN